MTIKRNDDIVMVENVLYQFCRSDSHSCAECAFSNDDLAICRKLHCRSKDRIDQLEGHFKEL